MNPGRAPLLLAGPALYALLASALAAHMPGEGGFATLLSCLTFTGVAIAALAVGAPVPLSQASGALIGLFAALAALLLPLPPPLHALLILLAGLTLGKAFALWAGPRVRDLSVLVTAALCLTLFDIWSVRFGPAQRAAAGGLLQRLLLDAPRPGGWFRFLGISDLVVVALLCELAGQRGLGKARGLVAGGVGIALSVVQADVTARPTPALPAIGLCFVLAHWPAVAPDRDGWRRTVKWALGSAALLGLLTLARLATR